MEACTKCKEEKENVEFRMGHHQCSDCAKKQKTSEYHRNRRAAYKKKYPEKYKERNRVRTREHYRKNKEKIRESCRKWRNNNPEKVKEMVTRYRKANPGVFRAVAHRRRARMKNIAGSFTAKEWDELCEKYGGLCVCCGEKKKLTVDHVIPVSKGGENYISNIQPLCQSCNSRKATKSTDYRRESV